MDGTALLTRNYGKGTEIEYDSDPEEKKGDGKSHKYIGEIYKIDYQKSSVLIKDESGKYVSYGCNDIKVLLEPATKENTRIAPPKKSKNLISNFKKYEGDPAPAKNKGFERIDFGLNLYYEMMGKTDYKDQDGVGKFMRYVEENDLQPDEIDEEINTDYQNCTYIEFDDDFPFKKVDDKDNNTKDTKTEENNQTEENDESDKPETEDNTQSNTENDNDNNNDKPKDSDKKIFDVIKEIWKHGFPKDHEGHPGSYQGYIYNSYSNGDMYNHHHHHHHHHHHGHYHGGYREQKPVFDPNIEFILPPQKENVIKDENKKLGDDDEDDQDDQDDDNEDNEDEEEEEDPRPKEPIISRDEDIKEEDMSSESELYEWESEPEEYKTMDGLERIDNGLKMYYEKLGRKYINEDGIGKFGGFADDNGLNDDDIAEEFEMNPDECTFIDFAGTEDEELLRFPLSSKCEDVEEIKGKIYRLIKYCHQYAQPPKSHVNDGDISLINGYIRMEIEEKFGIRVPVEILELIRDHAPSSKFFFSFEDDWSLPVTKDEILETKRITKVQMQNLVEEGDLSDLMPVITMGRKHDHFPIMQYLFDCYIRAKLKMFLKFGYGTRLFNCQPENWLTKYPFGNRLKNKDRESFDYILKGLKQYNYAKLFPCIVPMSLSIKDRKQVRDDLYKIFYYFAAIIKFITKLMSGRITPFQFDFTILPKQIFQLDGKVWKDNKTPILTVKQNTIVGDIKEKLELNKCIKVEAKIEDEKITETQIILDKLNELYDEYYKKILQDKKLRDSDDYPRRWRFCATVDRRGKDRKEDDLFIYEPSIIKRDTEKERYSHQLVNGDMSINKDTAYLIPELFHMNSMECLVPGKDHSNDIRTRLSFGFTLSFHCISYNKMKCYFWWDNSFMRFMPKDLYQVLPIWFEDVYKNNKQYRNDKTIQNEVEQEIRITDLHFIDFIKSWTMKG